MKRPLKEPQSRYRHNSILVVEGLGFLIIIILTWLDEAIKLPARLLGEWSVLGGWQEAVLETAVVILVALPIMAWTARLLRHLHYLERFLRVCAWCRKLELNGQWVSMEDFFMKNSQIEFTHGICQACSDKMAHEADLS